MTPRTQPQLPRLGSRVPTTATCSIIGFALALVAAVWLTGYRQLEDGQRIMRHEAAMKATNLAIALEHNVAITANDLDRLLLYIRQMRARAGADTAWQTLVKETYTVAEQAVQIAVIDKNGQMVTSTAMLYPKERINLSDREHYRFHLNSNDDVLYISKPMIGRASGKASVQFARRLGNPDGSFAGVIVVSLDPDYVTRNYSQIKLGSGGGLALLGTDGIVRAGTGRYQSMIGNGFREGTRLHSLASRSTETSVEIEKHGDGRLIIAARRLANYPLEVVVALDDVEASPAWTAAAHAYFVWSISLSVLILLVMGFAVFWQRRTESFLLRAAKHDNLTGLANRLSLQAELQAALRAPLEDSSFTLHLLDLDDFKPVNDTYGHPVGDKLLCAISARMLANVRDHDVVARLGGDEFAIIQRNVSCDADAVSFAERICGVLAKPYQIDGKELSVSVSIGLARATVDASTAADLINAADLALNCAKTTGGNGICRYRDAMSDSLLDQRELERDLKVAVTRNELTLHYQVIVDLTTGNSVGFEALLRWNHPTRGFVPPVVFIPIAERTGLINEIGAWALQRACLDAASWPEHLHVAVNCSPVQFRDRSLPAAIDRALRKAKLAPERLEIEITESTLMDHDATTLSQLSEISQLGVALSMDDFGTGYSSLSYLQTYPFSCLKIDRSFIQSLEGTASKIAIVGAIVQLANSLGLKTIAEGVETADQLQRLREMGCKEAQGYLFSKPIPIEQTHQFHTQQAEARNAA